MTLTSAVLILAGCQASTGQTVAPGSTPAAPPGAPGSQPTEGLGAPTQTALSTSASQASTGAGSGPGGADFPDGAWAAGSARAVVTGDRTATVDASLNTSTSLSATGNTLLLYVSADGANQISVAIYPTDVAVTVTTGAFVGGGGTTEDAPCDLTLARAEANAVQGTVTCTDAPAIGLDGTAGILLDMQITFSATR